MKLSTNDNNTLCTVTTSFLVVLDSENASQKNNDDWNSDITFDFESPIVRPPNSFIMSMCVQQFSSPNSIYNVNETNNYLHIYERINDLNVSLDIFIPYGNYNVNTFSSKLVSILGSITLQRFSMTFNSLNNKFTLSNTTNEFTIVNDSTMYNVMGFAKGTNLTSTLKTFACPYSCNFNGTQSINIMINNN